MAAMVVFPTAIMMALPSQCLRVAVGEARSSARWSTDASGRSNRSAPASGWAAAFPRSKRTQGGVLGNVGQPCSNRLADPIGSSASRLTSGARTPRCGTSRRTGRTGKNLLIAGKFAGPSQTRENLVLVNGATGKVIRWYDAPTLKTVLTAPGLGRVYGGGRSLRRSASPRARNSGPGPRPSVDPTIRTHDSKPAYRDLELDANGKTIWAACICDAVSGNPAKALVKLDTSGQAPHLLG